MFKLFVSLLAASGAMAHSIRLAPLAEPSHVEIIPSEFIVMLREPEFSATASVSNGDYSSFVDEHLNRLFGFGVNANHIIHKYNLGYAAVLNEEQVHTLRTMPEVDLIEANSVVKAIDVQNNPENWGLDRISHRDLPLAHEYVYGSKAGEGVDVYVVDTGVNIAHVEFQGRAKWGLTAPQGDKDEDGNGHGTHVASTIAGKSFGVAKKANIIAVKVLRSSGYGTMADVIKGIEFCGKEHIRKTAAGAKVKSVGNMSLGGGKSTALDTVVARVIAQGVQFAVAAGNDNRDACDSSPAAVEEAVTVGATDKYDARAWFSNYGECVDVFAPGHEIKAAWIGSKTATKTISGTSMASPHVAGVLALLSAEGDYTPAELKAKLLEISTSGKVRNPGYGSPNKLLFNGGASTEVVAKPSMNSIIESLRFQI